ILILMLAAMSFHLRQMNSLLYWLIPSIIYFNILFLDNSVAVNRYYTDSDSTEFYSPQSFLSRRVMVRDELLKRFKSLIVLRNGIFLMGDGFNPGEPYRAFKIANAQCLMILMSVQFEFEWSDFVTENCPITIKIADGSYNLNADR
ncbi:hypothetical protein EWB00_010153, partial [Schistosoma japonicum]